MRAAAVVLVALGATAARPGGGGSSPSTACSGISDGASCSKSGSDNFHTWSGSYDAKTGQFTGSMITNGCSQNKYGFCQECNGGKGMNVTHMHTASCQSVAFPQYTDLPAAAPKRGIIGMSVYGVRIYGPLENGFGGFLSPQPCMNGHTGKCSGGLDVPNCVKTLELSCGKTNVQYALMLDTCGGHAMPYHYHNDLKCDYDHTAPGHSPLIGVALDGRGIYGLYETSQTRPSDLDACSGHVGATPAFKGDGTASTITSAASSSVYHYHVSSKAPWTLGCYGPADLATCKSVTPGCGDADGYELEKTAEFPEGFCYDLECSCYDAKGFNNDGSGCGIVNTPAPPSYNATLRMQA